MYLERSPLGTLKKLHTQCKGPYKVLRRFGFNAYELDILHDLEISLVFNVEDLTLYHTFTGPQRFLVHLFQPPLLRRLTTEEFMQSFLIRLHQLQYRHSPVANFSKSGRIEGNQQALYFVQAIFLFILGLDLFFSFILVSYWF